MSRKRNQLVFLTAAILLAPVSLYATDFFGVTATGGGNSVTVGGSNLINLTDNLINEQGSFAPLAGQNIAATLSYGDAQQASSAADGVRSVDGWLKALGPLLGGLSLQNLDVVTDGKDMKCKFSLDEQALGNLLALAPRLLRGAR